MSLEDRSSALHSINHFNNASIEAHVLVESSAVVVSLRKRPGATSRRVAVQSLRFSTGH